MYKQNTVLLDLNVGKAVSLQGYRNILSLLSYQQGRSALILSCLKLLLELWAKVEAVDLGSRWYLKKEGYLRLDRQIPG